jgi:hypothetical protein
MLPNVRGLVNEIALGDRSAGDVDDVAGGAVAAGAGDDRRVLADTDDRRGERVA